MTPGFVAAVLGVVLGCLSAGTAPAQDVSYLYDDLGRLKRVIDGEGNVATYNYDAVGNILSIERGEGDCPVGPPAISQVTIDQCDANVSCRVTIDGTSLLGGAVVIGPGQPTVTDCRGDCTRLTCVLNSVSPVPVNFTVSTALGAAQQTETPPTLVEGVLTFDAVPGGPLPRGGTYAEHGMRVTSFSDFSSLGDAFDNLTGNGLYFHGTDQYVEFRMVDGSAFDLTSFDVLTNGFTNGRWVTASSGATQTFPGVESQTVLLGAGFQKITWFRIGTPFNATQVDNVRFKPYGPYAVVPDRGADDGRTTVRLDWSWIGGLTTAPAVMLQRMGQAEIVGEDTTIDPNEAEVTTTFDLASVAPGQWDVVIEAGANTFILAYAFTVEGASRMTFDTVPGGPLPRGGTYTESGMRATSFSDFSSLGDAFDNPTGNGLYFHGSDQYIEFRMVDGSAFDLTSFDVLTNGITNGRWVTASSGVTQIFPGVASQTVVLGAGFQKITWFRIGTPFNSTQVDNVRFRPYGPYELAPDRGPDDGPTTVRVNWSRIEGFTAAPAVTLQRTGQTEIVGQNTTVDPIEAQVTTTFNLAGVGPGQWDVVIEAGANTYILAYAFTVEGASRMTFDTVPGGPLPRGGTYTESGMRATSFSDFSSLGDAFDNPTGNGLYFHGSGQY